MLCHNSRVDRNKYNDSDYKKNWWWNYGGKSMLEITMISITLTMLKMMAIMSVLKFPVKSVPKVTNSKTLSIIVLD